jgi:hypothetical protein
MLRLLQLSIYTRNTMTVKFTPEAEARIKEQVVAKWTAAAFRCQPQGTQDRAAAAEAHKRLLSFVPSLKERNMIWLDTHVNSTETMPVFEWKEDEVVNGVVVRRAGHVEAIPKDWYKSATPAPDTEKNMYVITGRVRQNIATARLWLQTRDLSGHWLAGQHRTPVSAYIEFVEVHYQDTIKDNRDLAYAVAHHAANVGCCLCYDTVQFAGDVAVGHIQRDDRVIALWDDEHARAEGAVQQPDGTWA